MRKVVAIIIVAVYWVIVLTAPFNPILTTNRDVVPFFILGMVIVGAFSTINFVLSFPAEWPNELPGTKSVDETGDM